MFGKRAHHTACLLMSLRPLFVTFPGRLPRGIFIFTQMIRCGVFRELLAAVLLFALFASLHAQSIATLQGRVVDPEGAVVPGARIAVRNQATGVERIAQPTAKAITRSRPCPLAPIALKSGSQGFQTQIVESLIVEVGRTVVQDFQLRVGDISQEMIVTSDAQSDRAGNGIRWPCD